MYLRLQRALATLFLAACVALGSAVATPASASSEAAAYFHADLAPYGRWIDHPIYGAVWVPNSGRPDWHPYSDGRWVWTSDYGWYWHSYEPYGWATYHYGSWVLTSDYGWVWVPDDEWGPAWVEWRYGDGYAGWAPRPPEDRGPPASRRTNVSAGAWIFVPEQSIARADGAMPHADAAQVGRLLAASAAIQGPKLAATLKLKPQPVSTAASPAQQAAASANGTVAIYRLPSLATPNLDASAAGSLHLNVPVDTHTDIDPDAAAKAKAKLDESALPSSQPHGSFETTVGGSIGSDRTDHAPSQSSSGGLGVGLPGGGTGLRIGR
jgi:hypothetical protein